MHVLDILITEILQSCPILINKKCILSELNKSSDKPIWHHLKYWEIESIIHFVNTSICYHRWVNIILCFTGNKYAIHGLLSKCLSHVRYLWLQNWTFSNLSNGSKRCDRILKVDFTRFSTPCPLSTLH